MNQDTRNESPARRLAFGLVLMALGAVLFLDQIEALDIGELWRYWPLAVIALGVGGLFDAPASRRIGRDSALILNGVLMLLMSVSALGLRWGTHWPLLIIGGGIGVMLGALLDRGACCGVAVAEEVRHD